MNCLYYRDAEGAVIVYDLGDIESFESAKKWVQELHTFLAKEVPLVIAGNKADLPDRVVPEKSVAAFAESHKSKFFYTSAKTGENTEEMFRYLAQEIRAKKPKRETRSTITLAKTQLSTKKNKGCC